MAKYDESDIQDWIKDMAPKTDPNKSKLSILLDDILFEVSYFYRNNIKLPIKSFIHGISNIWKWRKIVYRDRWWDYSFLLDMIEFKIQDLEKNWGNNTHYVNDFKEKDTLRLLLEDIKWLNDPDNESLPDYEKQYVKISKRFFSRLDRNHRKFWD